MNPYGVTFLCQELGLCESEIHYSVSFFCAGHGGPRTRCPRTVLRVHELCLFRSGCPSPRILRRIFSSLVIEVVGADPPVWGQGVRGSDRLLDTLDALRPRPCGLGVDTRLRGRMR